MPVAVRSWSWSTARVTARKTLSGSMLAYINLSGSLWIRARSAGGAVMLANSAGALGFCGCRWCHAAGGFPGTRGTHRRGRSIIASRWMPGARISVQQPSSAAWPWRLFNALVRLMFGLRISDTQCGAKLLTRDAVQAILPHIGITQWAFDVDLLFQLRRADLLSWKFRPRGRTCPGRVCAWAKPRWICSWPWCACD